MKVCASGVLLGIVGTAMSLHVGTLPLMRGASWGLVVSIVGSLIVCNFIIVGPFIRYNNNNHYITLINKAIHSKNSNLIEYLLAHDADVDQEIYDNIDKTQLYFTPITPLKKVLKENNKEAIKLLLAYNARIDGTLFTTDVIENRETFVFLLTTWLYRQADVATPTLSKSFVNIAKDLAALISKLKPAEQIAFKEALSKCSQDILFHFQQMMNYFNEVKKGFNINNSTSSGDELEPLTYNQGAKENFGINNDHIIEINRFDSAFVFDSKDANNLLVSLFSTLNLDVVKQVSKDQKQLEMFIDYILEQGAYINIYFSHQDLYITPLHKAIMQNNSILVKYLLSRKANPNMPTGVGKRPLQLAVEQNDKEVALFLLENQPEPASISLIEKESLGFLNALKLVIGAYSFKTALALQKIT
jgi:ankyrin repeat protein